MTMFFLRTDFPATIFRSRTGESWGATWDSAWFHLCGQVPEEWRGKKVVAELDFNGEGLVFSDDGVPLQGITNGSVFDGRQSRCIFNLFDSCNGGEQVELWVEAAANALFGVTRTPGAGPESPIRYGPLPGQGLRYPVARHGRGDVAFHDRLHCAWRLDAGRFPRRVCAGREYATHCAMPLQLLRTTP